MDCEDVEVREREVTIEPLPAALAQRAGGGSLQARTSSVRSKLGDELYGLIRRDLPAFYEAIRDTALGEEHTIIRDKRGNPSRSYQGFLSTHRKMFIELMKMANADIQVDSADYSGDLAQFKQQLRGLSTDELKAMVGVSVDRDDD